MEALRDARSLDNRPRDCRRRKGGRLVGGARALVQVEREEADRLADESASSAAEANAVVDNSATFKLSMLGDMKAATDASLNANAVLADAVEAAEEADRLELLAEAALTAMETAIEQHLIDFPDSELRDQLEE